MKSYKFPLFCIYICAFSLISCTASQRGLFGQKTPHEGYANRIINAGLQNTALGSMWFNAAQKALSKPLEITLPYRETGFFSSEVPEAFGLKFDLKQGIQLHIIFSIKPTDGYMMFADLWQVLPDEKPKLLASADTASDKIEYEIEKDGSYLLRIQPELLASIEYTIEINTKPSLAFPVPSEDNPRIGSFWGDNRDNGLRKHEGIDIFAKFRTPVVAASNGSITRVTQNNLGGKVIFLRPEQKNYTLYYAHLDSQIAKEGEFVRTGDIIGLAGNTGNAKYTPSHLHFGIYTNGGAIDPLPFVGETNLTPKSVTAPLQNLNKNVRSTKASKLYMSIKDKSNDFIMISANSLLNIRAATGSMYKVILPNETEGFINSNDISDLDKPLRKLNLDSTLSLFNEPDTSAPIKAFLSKGKTVEFLAMHNNSFYFVSSDNLKGWIKK